MVASAPGSKIVPLAVATFVLGLIAVIATFTLPVTSRHEPPLWLPLACLLAPLGLLVGVAGVMRSSRRR
jgi:hypothetical protein